MADRWHLIEDDLLPTSLDELATLRARLLACGFSRPKVAGCIEFVLGKARGEEAEMGPSTRSTYRKMLAAAFRDRPSLPPDSGIVAMPMLLIAGIGTALVAGLGSGHGGRILQELLEVSAPIIQDSVNVEDELLEEPPYCCEPPLLLAA